jgi:hypothetical protein
VAIVGGVCHVGGEGGVGEGAEGVGEEGDGECDKEGSVGFKGCLYLPLVEGSSQNMQ